MTIKAELHVHLEGTISPTLAQKLAERNQLAIPDGLISPNGESYLSRDFAHFLQVYDTLAALIKVPQDYYDVTFDYLRTNALDDAIYVEMMYSPDHAEQTSGIPSIEHLHAIQQAIDDAESQFGIVGRIIVTAVRHFGPDAANRVAREISKASVPCVTGFGLGGDEINFHPNLFGKAYQMAADAGLQCTAHASEFLPPSDIIDAIEYLNVSRIGHGVQIIQSAEIMEKVKALGIALEICPSSNIKLGIFNDFKSHPLPVLLEAGIKVSLNSDDPPFMNTSLAKEYELTQQAYGYSDEKMESITAMAIESAFVDETTRKMLLKKLGCKEETVR